MFYKNAVYRAVLVVFFLGIGGQSIAGPTGGSVGVMSRSGATPPGGDCSPQHADKQLEVTCFFKKVNDITYFVIKWDNHKTGEQGGVATPYFLLLADMKCENLPTVLQEKERYPLSVQEVHAAILDTEFASSWWSLVPRWVLNRIGLTPEKLGLWE
ncbi:MAG: hypothetical protein PVJ92_02800 [Candidatus Dependentiae bacterium]|jgi:hypothetical protein